MDEGTSGAGYCKGEEEPDRQEYRSRPHAGRIRPLPPDRRRPSLIVVCARWWFEAASAGAALLITWLWASVVGLPVALSTEAVLLVAVAAAGLRNEWVGAALCAFIQRCVVPHRIRAGMVQAGATTMDGRIPMIVRSVCRKDYARISLWLPAGVVVDDLVDARAVLAGSCGAVDVAVLPGGLRRDRAIVIVVRPRWGWPGL